MSESTARVIRLTKAAGMREAADAVRENCYGEPRDTWERDFNFAMRDAADLILELAEEMEDNA